MNDLTDDQQQLAAELVKLVMQRVFVKIAPDLTDDDLTKLEQLNQEDEGGNSAREFLVAKFPDFDEMFNKEMENLKSELTPSDP